jgi:valyl-tRNA synthetase
MDAAGRQQLEERTRYEAGPVEQRILDAWLTTGAFDAEPDAPGEPYCITVPPPNVTGSLHMGHALNGTVQDLLIRLHRMRGRNVLWQPGSDHAGIATQMVVERQLREQGTSRHELGRERFVERVWEWRRETGTVIFEQFKRLGASMDYRRERFTMDPDYARAVLEVFVRLHAKGYIYRDHYLVNWSVGLQTAISDLEVEHHDVDDVLYEVAYPVEEGGEIRVATVRPITILADTAVAVHPDDERWRHLIGKTAIVPLVGRRVPIIADREVKPDFGTGALKITPGHDPVDFEIGRRHDLPTLTAIGFDGTMLDLRPDWEGLSAAHGGEAHERAVAELRETGALRGEEPYRHSVGHCSRSRGRIEPLVSLQWFCRMDELARPAIEAVREGRVAFHPKRSEKIYLDWMESIRPWCISRQLWWGHRLPVWFAPDGSYVVQIERPEGEGWEQSDDVLDTWFSSALWPYATLGWPEDTPELRTWYPGNVLSTARDIINLWVARMIMTGIEFLDEEPFTHVYIHSTIQAADGRRMSKSLGTGVNPLDLIDELGADATRYGLVKMSSTQDVRFAQGAIEEGAGLANKLWNAARFVLLKVDEDARPAPSAAEPIDRWMLSRLAATIDEVTADYDAFHFSNAAKTLYAFLWNEVCDWYIEALKLRLYGDDPVARRQASEMALFVLDRTLALLHPLMPFVTEEIWAFLPDREGYLMHAPPADAYDLVRDDEAERQVGVAVAAITGLRRLRQEAGLGPREPLEIAVSAGADGDALRTQADLLRGLGHAEVDGTDVSVGVPIPAGDATVAVRGDGLAGRLRERLRKRLADAEAERDKARKKLANERFVERAPAEVVSEERDRVARFGREADELRVQLAALGEE